MKSGSFKIDSLYASSLPRFLPSELFAIAYTCFTSRTQDNLSVCNLLIFLCLALPALFLCAEESLYFMTNVATAFAAFDFFRRFLVDIYASPCCRYRQAHAFTRVNKCWRKQKRESTKRGISILSGLNRGASIWSFFLIPLVYQNCFCRKSIAIFRVLLTKYFILLK